MLASCIWSVDAVLDSSATTLPSSQSSAVQCFPGWILPTPHTVFLHHLWNTMLEAARAQRNSGTSPSTCPSLWAQPTWNQLHSSTCTPEHGEDSELHFLFTYCRANVTTALLTFIKVKGISQCKGHISRMFTASPQSLAVPMPPPLSSTGTLVSSLSKRKLLA